jgi:hypothetical protein
MGVFDEKTRGQKYRDTVSLLWIKNISGNFTSASSRVLIRNVGVAGVAGSGFDRGKLCLLY